MRYNRSLGYHKLKISFLLLIVFFSMPIFAHKQPALYGIFANTGYSSDRRSYFAIDSNFLCFNTSTVWKPSKKKDPYLDFSAGIGLLNLIHFQHGWGSKSNFLKINFDLPLLYLDDTNPLLYEYAPKYFYRRINLNLNYSWYYKEKDKVFSIGVGCLLL